MSQTYTVERPPRQQPELPEGEVDIPAPPDEKENPAQPLIQLALPLVTVIGYVLTAALGQGRNPVVLIPMGLSVFISIAMALYLRQRQSRLRQEKREVYAQCAPYRRSVRKDRPSMIRRGGPEPLSWWARGHRASAFPPPRGPWRSVPPRASTPGPSSAPS